MLGLLYGYLTKDGANEKTGKPLAPKTIKHNLSLISEVFSYAVKMGAVSENPCRKVTISKAESKEKQVYTPEQIKKMLCLLEHEPMKYRVFVHILVYSGLRRGEMIGLEWKDIDFENCVITVRRTSNYTGKRVNYTDQTKTRKSRRALKLPQHIMELLRTFRAEQDAHALKCGDQWVETDRLFTKWNGETMYNGQPYSWLKDFYERNDLPFFGIHAFRHTYASILVNQGVDIVAVSFSLGHSQVSTTSNIYCHMLDNARAKAANAISSVLDTDSGFDAQISK